ncbi:MAG: hypothetical protein VXW32_09280 [Myxococcota bacterium]|nr:hypothetical protein [Myxococcota bacterium]
MRIALVSDAPIAALRRPLSESLAHQGIPSRYTVIEHASGDFQEAAAELHDVQPQVTVMVTEPTLLVEELYKVETLLDPVALRRRICDAAVDTLVERAGALRTGTGGTLLVMDLPVPTRSPLGIQDTAVELGLKACIERINAEFSRRIRKLPRVRVVSFSSVVSRVGRFAFDVEMANLGASHWSAEVFREMGSELTRHVFAMLGRTRQVLIVEADGVLWGGSAEERGAAGIQLDERDRSREFLRVQEALLNLRKRGVRLALTTRTSRDDVLDAMTQHPQMRLRPHHFDHMEMRWTDKATLIQNVCERLEVETNQVVYADSSTSESTWVAQTLEDVEVLHFTAPMDLVDMVNTHMSFESDRLFLEAEPPLTHLQPWTSSNTGSPILESVENYLETLETQVSVGLANRADLVTLQATMSHGDVIDLTGRKLTKETAIKASENPRCEVWWVRLEDRYEENSLVGMAVLHRGENAWTMQHFMLATHVMARGVDSAVLVAIAQAARESGAESLHVPCVRRPGQQSLPGSSFATMGLEKVGFSANGVNYNLVLKEGAISRLWRPTFVQCSTVRGDMAKEVAA